LTGLDSTLVTAMGVGLLGGLVRGTTGFGAAMVMTPLLALMLGPRIAVPVTLLLESVAALPMVPAAIALARWRVIGPISLAACTTVPLGGLLLGAASAQTLRRLIAMTVIGFALALLSGRRYLGAPRLGTSLALGALSGGMLGATSIGAPPIILYLLSGPDPAAITRANLTLYIIVISVAGLVMLALAGLLDLQALTLAAWLAPGFVLGLMAGGRLFARLTDERFRRLTMVFMMMVAVWVLIA
jgi:uncharacterized membrane protein YfcA